MKLYEVAQEFEIIERWLEESEGEVTEDLDQLLALSRENLERKTEAYCQLISNTNADAKAIDEEIKRLQARKKTAENKIKQLKDNLLFNYQRMGIKEAVKAGVFKVKVQNASVPKLIVDDSMEVLPAHYMQATLNLPAEEVPTYLQSQAKYEPDCAKIRQALQGGLEVGGCRLETSQFIKIW